MDMSTPDMPEPQTVRMPTETDPAILAAGERAKGAARKRKGRQSTILTDSLQSRTQSLGG